MRLRRGALALIAGVALLLGGCGLLPQPGSTPAYDVDDFEFDSAETSYVLLRDAEGGSRLRTVERLTAVFPDADQNRGIQRSIPVYPSVAAVGFEMIAVTDGDGTRRPFEIAELDGVVTVTIAVPEGEFVHGEQVYEITYEQGGVIHAVGEVQELSWDVNGTGWSQPFGTVSATIELAGDLATRVYSEPFCYTYGDDGPLGECEFRGGDGVYAAEVDDVAPGESLHIVVQFQPGTFG